MGTFDDNRRTHGVSSTRVVHATSGASASRSLRPTRRHRAAPQGRPLPVRARRPGAAGPGLLRGLQHPGLRPGAAAARDRQPQGRDRRLGRPRLHPRADRRGPGDGPAGPAAQRHPRLHDAGLRHQRPRPRPTPGAWPRRSGITFEEIDIRPAAEQMLDGHGPPVRRGRAGLRRHLRERPGRPAHRLPLPARQPARRHRARHRRPVRAGARAGAPTASATRCRTTRSTPACPRR